MTRYAAGTASVDHRIDGRKTSVTQPRHNEPDERTIMTTRRFHRVTTAAVALAIATTTMLGVGGGHAHADPTPAPTAPIAEIQPVLEPLPADDNGYNAFPWIR